MVQHRKKRSRRTKRKYTKRATAYWQRVSVGRLENDSNKEPCVAHHWILEPAVYEPSPRWTVSDDDILFLFNEVDLISLKPEAKGVCKNCGAEKDFNGGLEGKYQEYTFDKSWTWGLRS